MKNDVKILDAPVKRQITGKLTPSQLRELEEIAAKIGKLADAFGPRAFVRVPTSSLLPDGRRVALRQSEFKQ